jgi:hypothetical protein
MCGKALPFRADSVKDSGGYASERLFRGVASLKNIDATVRQSLTAHQAAQPQLYPIRNLKLIL